MPQGAILTAVGLSKLASATPLDQLTVTHFAVGDGNGGYPTLSPNMTALVNEVWRGVPSPPIRDANNSNNIIFEVLIPPTQGGFTVREIGVFDNTGDMIAIGQTSVVEKPLPSVLNNVELKVRLYVQLSNSSQVELFFQTTPVISAGSIANENGGTAQDDINDWKGFTDALYAESGIVDDGLPDNILDSKRLTALHTLFDESPIIEASRLPDASTTAKGATTLSNSINGVSESLAVTEKALTDAIAEASETTFVYNGGDLTQMTEALPRGGRVTDFIYTSGSLTQVVEVYNGVTTTTTYTYDGSGTLTGVTRL